MRLSLSIVLSVSGFQANKDVAAEARAGLGGAGGAAAQVAGQVVLDTEKIFGGQREVRIRHRGEEYRLRITKQGKLILTK